MLTLRHGVDVRNDEMCKCVTKSYLFDPVRHSNLTYIYLVIYLDLGGSIK
jgi:hypothetical protein